MAACHPKLKTHPGAELFLSRFADGEWRGLVRPWLEAGRGSLERSIVIAPTRGQTQALKQRCLEEGVSLLGVEFVTPSLARKKRGAPAGLQRSLQLLVLRARIEAHVSALAPDDRARGLWRSLASDLESALSDFEDLLRGGFRAEHFPGAEVRAVFGELSEWAAGRGYVLGPLQDEADALGQPRPGEDPIADRLLILAGGAEGWPDFFGLVAVAKRCRSVTVVVAEPEFQGKRGSDEEWVDAWESALGVPPLPIEAEEPPESCSGVAELWSGGEGSPDRARVLVGASRSDEMELVADAVERLLRGGSESVAVVFPRAGSAHSRLVGLLDERRVAYCDLIGAQGTPPVEIRIQRALADFHERGCRLEELLALWPLLQALNLVKLTQAEARRACQELFDEAQSHAIEPQLARLGESDRPRWQEVARVARLLLPAWPAQLSPAEALGLFEAARDRLGVAAPAGWHALQEFAGRAAEPMPAGALLAAIRSFLPEKGPIAASPGKSPFARVTLTTLRRAAGTSWSDVILAEANSRIWPEKREPSLWLGDEARRELDMRHGRFSLGLPTSDDRAVLERRLCSRLARDTRASVVFSAALFSEENPDVRLAPNGWLERVMWRKGLLSAPGSGPGGFERLAAGTRRAVPDGWPSLAAWSDVWLRRRDPAAPFDEYFLAEPGGGHRPRSLSTSQIDRGIGDPATLWFGAVLRVRRVDWHPFRRERRKAVGTAVHAVLKNALRGVPAEGGFFQFPERAGAEARLAAELSRLRARWPADRYWDSFHGDVSRAARQLLERVYELPPAGFGAVELKLPDGASVPVGGSERICVHGRIDLVLSDRPRWDGSRVDVADFKTGSDPRLSARRMASTGASLQLGVYLEAARSLGASGSVWMLKPEERPASLGMAELERACARLPVLGAHLATGIYGARTPDRTDYSHGFEWPLACAPIDAAILEDKFAATFGDGAGAGDEGAPDE
jgi:hypothetical protein